MVEKVVYAKPTIPSPTANTVQKYNSSGRVVGPQKAADVPDYRREYVKTDSKGRVTEEQFLTGGGDVIYKKYYNWTNVYGQELREYVIEERRRADTGKLRYYKENVLNIMKKGEDKYKVTVTRKIRRNVEKGTERVSDPVTGVRQVTQVKKVSDAPAETVDVEINRQTVQVPKGLFQFTIDDKTYQTTSPEFFKEKATQKIRKEQAAAISKQLKVRKALQEGGAVEALQVKWLNVANNEKEFSTRYESLYGKQPEFKVEEVKKADKELVRVITPKGTYPTNIKTFVPEGVKPEQVVVAEKPKIKSFPQEEKEEFTLEDFEVLKAAAAVKTVQQMSQTPAKPNSKTEISNTAATMMALQQVFGAGKKVVKAHEPIAQEAALVIKETATDIVVGGAQAAVILSDKYTNLPDEISKPVVDIPGYPNLKQRIQAVFPKTVRVLNLIQNVKPILPTVVREATVKSPEFQNFAIGTAILGVSMIPGVGQATMAVIGGWGAGTAAKGIVTGDVRKATRGTLQAVVGFAGIKIGKGIGRTVEKIKVKRFDTRMKNWVKEKTDPAFTFDGATKEVYVTVGKPQTVQGSAVVDVVPVKVRPAGVDVFDVRAAVRKAEKFDLPLDPMFQAATERQLLLRNKYDISQLPKNVRGPVIKKSDMVRYEQRLRQKPLQEPSFIQEYTYVPKQQDMAIYRQLTEFGYANPSSKVPVTLKYSGRLDPLEALKYDKKPLRQTSLQEYRTLTYEPPIDTYRINMKRLDFKGFKEVPESNIKVKLTDYKPKGFMKEPTYTADQLLPDFLRFYEKKLPGGGRLVGIRSKKAQLSFGESIFAESGSYRKYRGRSGGRPSRPQVNEPPIVENVFRERNFYGSALGGRGAGRYESGIESGLDIGLKPFEKTRRDLRVDTRKVLEPEFEPYEKYRQRFKPGLRMDVNQVQRQNVRQKQKSAAALNLNVIPRLRVPGVPPPPPPPPTPEPKIPRIDVPDINLGKSRKKKKKRMGKGFFERTFRVPTYDELFGGR